MCVDLNCAVINMSLGGFPPQEEKDMFNEALRNVVAKGMVPVCASGNEMLSTKVAFPAESEYCIAVGSVNALFMRSWFSNVDPIRKNQK
jgi:Subtilase family.